MDVEGLALLNRRHRRLWVLALAFHGVDALGSAGLLLAQLPLGPEPLWILVLVYAAVKLLLWVLVTAEAVRLARAARPWWGHGPGALSLAAALGAVLPIALAALAGFRMRSLARRLSLPGGFFGLPSGSISLLRHGSWEDGPGQLR